MINDGDFATQGIMCRAKPGVCFTGGKCSSCEVAYKYHLTKKMHMCAETCDYKMKGELCGLTGSECVVSDCTNIQFMAEKMVKKRADSW